MVDNFATEKVSFERWHGREICIKCLRSQQFWFQLPDVEGQEGSSSYKLVRSWAQAVNVCFSSKLWMELVSPTGVLGPCPWLGCPPRLYALGVCGPVPLLSSQSSPAAWCQHNLKIKGHDLDAKLWEQSHGLLFLLFTVYVWEEAWRRIWGVLMRRTRAMEISQALSWTRLLRAIGWELLSLK